MLLSAIGKAPKYLTTPALTSSTGEPVAGATLAGVRVLLVEDNVVNQCVAKELLTRLGCHARVARSGADGLSAFAQETFDLVLMDCQMPELDGLSTTIEFRRRFGRRTPVIALTAVVTDDVRKRCADAGMDDYLSKPIRPAELRVMIERWTSFRSTPAEQFNAMEPTC